MLKLIYYSLLFVFKIYTPNVLTFLWEKNQFNPYRNRRRSNKKLDQIEDADFEDLSDNN